MHPELRFPCEARDYSVLKLRVLEPVDSAESRERDSATDATDEEGQDTLVRSRRPLVAVIDLHRGHEQTDQPRVEDLWVGGHVSHNQLHEHVLKVRSGAQQADHVRVNESRRLDGNLQPFIVEYAVIVVPRVRDRTVSACQALGCSARVIEVVEEQDGFVFALSWPRVLLANRWWRWSCATAASVEPPLRSSFIHLQPKSTIEDRKSGSMV